MRRVIYWLRKKKRLEKRDCGKCCVTCKYYKQCITDGEF